MLSWRLSAPECDTPRRIPYKMDKRMVIYPDALGAMHISALVIRDGVRHSALTYLPAWLIPSGAGIFECELPAVVLGVYLALFFLLAVMAWRVAITWGRARPRFSVLVKRRR